MSRQYGGLVHRIRTILAVGLFLVALAIAVAGGTPSSALASKNPPPTPTPSTPPDFSLSVNYAPPSFAGFLIRGETWDPHPLCNLCTTYGGPHYVVPDPLGCFYDANSIGVVGLNGFGGTVNLAILNLPAGVTSVTATSMVIPRGGANSVPFKLQAAGSAALGSATVTIQASSSTIVHTLNLPISTVDQPPACQ